MSHLTRGAWIEIDTYNHGILYYKSRTSHEVRGLKLKILKGEDHE